MSRNRPRNNGLLLVLARYEYTEISRSTSQRSSLRAQLDCKMEHKIKVPLVFFIDP